MSVLISGPITQGVLEELRIRGLCEAGRPHELGWLFFCEERVTGAWQFACVHEHVRDARLCDHHGAEALQQLAGCIRCLDAGHVCQMVGRRLETIA